MEEESSFDYTYNPNYQTSTAEGDEDAVYAPTAEKTPSICTSGAAYIGDNIVTNGEYVAVVDPANTEQKTLIKNDSVETGKVTCSDVKQNNILNRDATDVIPFTMVFITSSENLTPNNSTSKFVFHRMTEFLAYVCVLGISGKSVSYFFSEETVNKIKAESLVCKNIGTDFTVEGKSFPKNVSTRYYASMAITVTVQATDGTTKDYDASLMINRGILYIVFSGDLFELGKGDHTLCMITLSGFSQLVLLPSNNSLTSFKSTLGL